MKCPVCGSELKVATVGKAGSPREQFMICCKEYLDMNLNCHYHTQWFPTVEKAINHHFDIVDMVYSRKNPKRGWFK